MVLVVHPGGWVTLYAHNSVNFVVAGEKMARGAVLAELGATGNALGPHVHFEFIYAGQNCDPSALFRPGVRLQNGKMARLKYYVWKNPERRPEQIRCGPRRRHPRGKSVIDETPTDESAVTPSADENKLPTDDNALLPSADAIDPAQGEMQPDATPSSLSPVPASTPIP